MTTLHSRKSIDPSPLRTGFVLFTLIAALVLVPTIQAVTPAPDGGYPNGNTAEGNFALFSLTTGVNNTAIGFQALFSNTNGGFNTASGYGALLNNSTGSSNTANGAGNSSFPLTGALANNTSGNRNTATGSQALSRNQTGNGNTAEGFQALANNSGSFNVAVGFAAGFNLTTGRDNIDIGA